MSLLAAEPRITAAPLFPSQCPCWTIMLTLYSMVWDWRVSRTGQCLFIGLSFYIHFCLLLFNFFFCLYVVIVGLGSLDWQGVDHSLPAFHDRHLLLIIVTVNVIFCILVLKLWRFLHCLLRFARYVKHFPTFALLVCDWVGVENTSENLLFHLLIHHVSTVSPTHCYRNIILSSLTILIMIFSLNIYFQINQTIRLNNFICRMKLETE